MHVRCIWDDRPWTRHINCDRYDYIQTNTSQLSSYLVAGQWCVQSETQRKTNQRDTGRYNVSVPAVTPTVCHLLLHISQHRLEWEQTLSPLIWIQDFCGLCHFIYICYFELFNQFCLIFHRREFVSEGALCQLDMSTHRTHPQFNRKDDKHQVIFYRLPTSTFAVIEWDSQPRFNTMRRLWANTKGTIFQCTLGHDDDIKWKHLPLYWPFVRGTHRSPEDSPNKGQWRGALMFSLICAWKTVNQTIETLVISEAIALIMFVCFVCLFVWRHIFLVLFVTNFWRMML